MVLVHQPSDTSCSCAQACDETLSSRLVLMVLVPEDRREGGPGAEEKCEV